MQDLSKNKVNIVCRGSRKKKVSSFKAAVETNRLFSFPDSFHKYREMLKNAFRLGVQDAQQSMTNLPAGFKNQLQNAGFWEKPFSFDIDESLITTNVPQYNKIDIPISLRKQDNKSSSQSCDPLPSESENIDSLLESGHENDIGMYINRSGKPMHLKTALKICIAGRDNVPKDRGMRHMVGFTTNHVPIPEHHTVLPLHYAAVKSKQRGVCDIMQIMCIEEGGERRRSASVLSKSLFRGLLLEPMNENTLWPTMRLSPWKSVKDIICAISLETDPLSASLIVSCQSIQHLKEAGFTIMQEEDVFSENEVPSDVTNLNADEYIIERILEKRLNRFEEEEYLIKFKDHPHCQNEWIHSSNIIGCVPFTSTSRSGRKRFHTTKSDDVQPPVKQIKFQPCFRKRKCIPLPSFSENESNSDVNLPAFDFESSQKSKQVKVAKCFILGNGVGQRISDSKEAAPSMTGLKNYGHSCWLNSTIQAIRSVYPFIKNTRDNSDILLSSLWEICRIMNDTKKSIVEPKNLLTIAATELELDQSKQHDASEFLLHILSRVQPNCINVDWETHMTDCGHEFHEKENNSCLMLPLSTTTSDNAPLLHSSTEECLNAYVQIEERLDNVCCPQATCKQTSDCMRKPTITKCENLLVLILKRFAGTKKLRHKIHLAPILFVKNKTYRLKTVQCHKGQSPVTGHYLTYVIHENVIVEYDDCKHRQFSSADILASDSVTMNAYVIYYVCETDNNQLE